MSFVQRKINISISLGEGNFGTTGFNTVKLTGLRVRAQVQRYGAPGLNTAQVQIFGMSLATMNQLSTLGKPSQTFRRNNILIEAGDTTDGMSIVFQGAIDKALVNANSMPQVSLDMSCILGEPNGFQPALPTSYQTSANAADIIGTLAKKLGYTLENNSVSVMLANPYLDGTVRNQIQKVVESANIYCYFDDLKKVVAIWPYDGRRQGSAVDVSPSTGMVGYPSYSDKYIQFRVLYTPNITFGGAVNLKSDLTGASGTWTVNLLHHTLESEIPGGAWFSEVEGYRFGDPEPGTGETP